MGDEISDSISEACGLLDEVHLLTGEQKFVEASATLEKIDRILDEVNQHDLQTGVPELDDGIEPDELELASQTDFRPNELNNIDLHECACDDKLSQFDLEERLLGDEADPDVPDQDLFELQAL